MVICDAHCVRDEYSSGTIKWKSETSCAQHEVAYISSTAHTHQSDKTIHSLVLMPSQFTTHSRRMLLSISVFFYLPARCSAVQKSVMQSWLH